MDPAGAQASLGEGEALAFFADEIRDWHLHVPIGDFAVSVDREMIEDCHVALNLQPRGIQGRNYHRMARVRIGIRSRIGQPHHNDKLRIRVERAAGKPLAAIDDVLRALTPYRSLKVRRVGGRSIRLSDADARTDFALKQWHEPAFSLLLRRKEVQELHVSSIRCAAVENLGAPRYAAHQFRKRRILKITEPRTGLVVTQSWQEQVPEPLGLGPILKSV